METVGSKHALRQIDVLPLLDDKTTDSARAMLFAVGVGVEEIATVHGVKVETVERGLRRVSAKIANQRVSI